MQILHNGHNHWLVTSSTGSRKSSEIYIYDSMYCNTTSEVQKIVAALLFTNESHITSNLCKCNVAHKTPVFLQLLLPLYFAWESNRASCVLTKIECAHIY